MCFSLSLKAVIVMQKYCNAKMNLFLFDEMSLIHYEYTLIIVQKNFGVNLLNYFIILQFNFNIFYL